MLSLGALSFAAPWILVALVALPILWWLLRAVPPSPRRVPFPAIRLLFDLRQREETPHRTPWWLLLLRLALAALIIVALAQPLINPTRSLQGSGPLVLAIDDGWAAADGWEARRAAAFDLIEEAARTNRAVHIVATAAGDGRGERVEPLTPAAARERIREMAPKPWHTDRAAAVERLSGIETGGAANVVWLSDGLVPNDTQADRDAAEAFAEALAGLGALRVLQPDPAQSPGFIAGVKSEADGLVVTVRRPVAAGPQPVSVVATGERGRLVGRETLALEDGAATGEVRIGLPGELRNEVVRVAIEGEESAGGVMLIDESFRRRPVGVVSGDAAQVDQPLLGNAYYLHRALEPFAEIHEGTIEELLEQRLAVIVLSDIGTLTDTQAAALEAWVAEGGVLVRFAGPNLAEGSDTLLPVPLRRGGRIFGGVMSWDRPATLAPFDDQSPFAGLDTREEVVVRRQVLAEPSPELAARTWARLSDGTPMVTGDQRDQGWLVLFHTTANAEWSSLALSGLYVDMLRRLVALSQGVSGTGSTEALRPLLSLDGFGRLADPPASARPLRADAAATAAVGPRTPPGFYGLDASRVAVNLGPTLAPVPLAGLPAGTAIAGYGPSEQADLRSWLFIAAFVLLLADFLIAQSIRGLLPVVRTRATAAALALAVAAGGLLLGGEPAAAQSGDRFAIEATDQVHLAYVLTGDTRVDEISRAGLAGLGRVLEARTSVVPGAPFGLDVERDELAFFPIVYWPITSGQARPSDRARAKINNFLRHGGTILFDTRDQNLSGIGGIGPGTQKLRELVAGLDIPGLTPVPPEHVLTKAFYLLQEFPGRWDGGRLWVQRPDERVNDGVSAVIVGANDFAAAWAIDAGGRPLLPVVPGGGRQRELAFRFGVNLVMYALTGNYKADQVHVDAILERLGQ